MKLFALFFISLMFLGIVVNAHAEESIPFWIKNNALWWSVEKIDDDEFAKGVDWLIFNDLVSSSYYSENKIPHWFKTTVHYWTSNLIPQSEFLNSLEYLLDQDLLTVKSVLSPSDYTEYRFSGNNEIFILHTYEKDFYFENDAPIPRDTQFELKSDFENLDDILYDSEKQNAVVIIPLFTSSAYWEPGFYTFFRNECSTECLTTPIEYSKFFGYSGSDYSVKILSLLGYPMISDIDVDQDPSVLEKFDSVIVLHNEYVTQREFDSISTHSNVLHLYPNSLYGKISVNYVDDTITLIRGHDYPEDEIDNGFDWEHENTHPYEFDSKCLDWNFYPITNGKMLNCYPEYLIIDDFEFLKAIKFHTLK
jgi:hypothetical protein